MSKKKKKKPWKRIKVGQVVRIWIHTDTPISGVVVEKHGNWICIVRETIPIQRSWAHVRDLYGFSIVDDRGLR